MKVLNEVAADSALSRVGQGKGGLITRRELLVSDYVQ